MTRSWRRATTIGALLIGLALLGFTLERIDAQTARQLSRLFGPRLALALLPGAGWHLLRTEAWRRSFPTAGRTSFSRLFRIRLSAEAFSYLTIAGVTGEPLKVMLLAPAVPAPLATAATALERAAYTIVTAAVVAFAAIVTIASVPLTAPWTRIYAWIAAVAAAIATVPLVLAFARRSPRDRSVVEDVPSPRSRAGAFLRQSVRQFQILLTGDRRRIAIVAALEAGAFLMMSL